MRRALFVLQNAWRSDARPGQTDWNDRLWRRALWHSQTGKRLKEMIPEGVEWEVINASRVVSSRPRVEVQAEIQHVLAQVHQFRPEVVVLLGKVAQSVRGALDGSYDIVEGPHPAWRLLSKERTLALRAEIEGRLRQSAEVT